MLRNMEKPPQKVKVFSNVMRWKIILVSTHCIIEKQLVSAVKKQHQGLCCYDLHSYLSRIHLLNCTTSSSLEQEVTVNHSQFLWYFSKKNPSL